MFSWTCIVWRGGDDCPLFPDSRKRARWKKFFSSHALLSPSCPSPTHPGAPGARPVVRQPENDPTGGGALAVQEQIEVGAQSVALWHDGQAGGKWQAAFRRSGRFPH